MSYTLSDMDTKLFNFANNEMNKGLDLLEDYLLNAPSDVDEKTLYQIRVARDRYRSVYHSLFNITFKRIYNSS